jgi:hypothetical protein
MTSGSSLTQEPLSRSPDEIRKSEAKLRRSSIRSQPWSGAVWQMVQTTFRTSGGRTTQVSVQRTHEAGVGKLLFILTTCRS